MRTGFEGFEQYEALELLLTYAIPRRDVKPLAKDLIKRFGGLRGVMDATHEDLVRVDGINERTATYIAALKAAVVLYQRAGITSSRRISSTAELLDFLDAAMSGLKDEQFRVVFLNSRNEVVAEEVVSEGTVNQSAVYPRKVMERALRHKATAIIFVHNHPGGNCKPSPEDIGLTKKLVKVAEGLQITVHDHIIICGDKYFSFLESGLL